mmetsp:Transcript_32508/g.49013  ORF Transcript_32508/g.49013 Transcript_32508/m.49013 type:complete len:316 (-) Transcript_32508:127-1074(-)
MKSSFNLLAGFALLFGSSDAFQPSGKYFGLSTFNTQQETLSPVKLYSSKADNKKILKTTPGLPETDENLFTSAATNQFSTWQGSEDVSKLIGIGIVSLLSLAVIVAQEQVLPAATTNIIESIQQASGNIWSSYMQVLTTSPVQTKAVTSATVYAIGDVISQRTEGTELENIDRMRTLRSLVAGLIGHGPLSHVWYNFNEHVFNDLLHWTAWWSVFPKVVLDQSMAAPIWNNTYILLIGLMKRDSLGTIWGDCKRTTIPLIVSGLKLWPFVHLITYGLVPIENRLLWVDFVEIIWVTILATQAAGGAKETAKEATE